MAYSLLLREILNICLILYSTLTWMVRVVMEFLFFFYNSSTLHSVLVNSEVTYSIRNIFILIFVVNTVFMYIMVFILSETGGVWNFF